MTIVSLQKLFFVIIFLNRSRLWRFRNGFVALNLRYKSVFEWSKTASFQESYDQKQFLKKYDYFKVRQKKVKYFSVYFSNLKVTTIIQKRIFSWESALQNGFQSQTLWPKPVLQKPPETFQMFDFLGNSEIWFLYSPRHGCTNPIFFVFRVHAIFCTNCFWS